MTGGQFYTVLMQQTNKRLATRLKLGTMKEKQKVKAITRYRQREVLFTGYIGCGKSSLLRAVVHHYTLPTCSIDRNGEIVMFMGVGRGKPKGSYPAKFIIIDSSGYDEEHGGVVRFVLAYRPNLKKVFLMVDASKGFREQDRSMLEYINGLTVLRNQVQPVITKVDLIPPEEQPKIAEQIYEEIKKTSPWTPAPILSCSRKDKQMGIEEIRRSIADAADLPYEEAWVSRNGPRPKPPPLADATNAQDGDAKDASAPSEEENPGTKPPRLPKPESRRADRTKRTEQNPPKGEKSARPAQAAPDLPLWAERARKRQMGRAKREEADSRRAVRREGGEAKSRQRPLGFGLKKVASEQADL